MGDLLGSFSKSVWVRTKHAKKSHVGLWGQLLILKIVKANCQGLRKGYLWKVLTNKDIEWSVIVWSVVEYELLSSQPLGTLHMLFKEICQQGKQIKTSFKSKDVVSTSRLLQHLHMDLFGPTRTLSLGGKKYVFVIVDDYF